MILFKDQEETPLKSKDTIWIKASGMKLKDANEKEIFVPLDLNQTLINLKSNKSKKEIFKVNQKTSLRASMETGTHALLKYKYVIHTHPS